MEETTTVKETELAKIQFGESLKSRKFIFTLVIFIVNTALLIYGFVTDAIWSQVTVGAMLAYLTGNVTQSVLTKRP